MKYNSEVLNRQYPVVALFVRHLAYARGLRAATANLADHKEFWESTASAHLELAVVEWCKVFGSDGEKTHWKKVLAGNIEEIEEQDLEEFRRRILAKTGLTKKQWETYHKKMLSLRGKYVAHLDLSKPFSEPAPIFDSALQVAYAYQEWVKWLIRASLHKSMLLIWDNPGHAHQTRFQVRIVQPAATHADTAHTAFLSSLCEPLAVLNHFAPHLP